MLMEQRYITSFAEAAVLLTISYWYEEMMTFEHSNIVERMGALTLIILGEGVIAMTESVSFMLRNGSRISTSSVGLVIAAVLTVYVLWMLYFDHADNLDHPGARINKQKPWCQIWAFLHFPLHTAILLTLEGSARFVIWSNANRVLDFVLNSFWTSSDTFPDVKDGIQLSSNLQLELKNINATYPFFDSEISKPDFKSYLTDLQNLGSFVDSPELVNKSYDIMNSMLDSLINRTNELYDVEVSFTSHGDIYSQVFEAFLDWYIAFFVAAGLVLVLLALQRYVGHQPKRDGRIKPPPTAAKLAVPGIAVILQFSIGIALASVSLFAKWQDSDQFYNFVYSPWIIPTVLLAFCLGKWFSIFGVSCGG